MDYVIPVIDAGGFSGLCRKRAAPADQKLPTDLFL
jgi:hypothetical protein